MLTLVKRRSSSPILQLVPVAVLGPGGWIRGNFTASQAAAALRPFYFAVHPDLFGPYPEMCKTNEQSLKALNGYIDALYSKRSEAVVQPKSVSLKFYLRDKYRHNPPVRSRLEIESADALDRSATFRTVQLNLHDRDPCLAVRTILETCSLPTAHLPECSSKESGSQNYQFRQEADYRRSAEDEELLRFWSRKKKSDAGKWSAKNQSPTESFRNWLIKSSAEAAKSRHEHEKVQKDIRMRISELKRQTGVLDVRWNVGWALTHCRGCLQLLHKSLQIHHLPVINLKGWMLKFGRHGSYISLDKSVVFGVDDLPSEWLNLIVRLAQPNAYYSDLPTLEGRLSKLLGDAVVTGLPDSRLYDYKRWLSVLTDRLMLDDWTNGRVKPAALSGIVLSVQNESCGLMVAENGSITVPVSTLPRTLLKFLADNERIAREMSAEYAKMQAEVKQLQQQCMMEFRLNSIEWGDSGYFSQRAIKQCLERVLSMADDKEQGPENLKALMNGQQLHIGQQSNFVVLPDGRLSIPCDFGGNC